MKVFTGTIAYTNKRLAEYRKLGYVVTKRKTWVDKKLTYVMEKQDENESKT